MSGEPSQPPPSSTARKPERARSALRRWLGRLGVVMLGVLVLLGSGIFYLHTSSGKELVRTRIESRLGERVRGTVRLGHLDYQLFGAISLGELSIKDGAGHEVIRLDSLRIVPSWASLLSDEPTLEDIELRGLAIEVEQYADGSSNLKQLFIPTPAKPSSGPAKPSERRLYVSRFDVRDLSFSLAKPDHSKLRVTNVLLRGALSANPDQQSVDLRLDRLGLDLERRAPGVALQLRELSLGLKVNLDRGAGKIALTPMHAILELERDGKPKFQTPIVLGKIGLEVRPGELEATLDKLVAGLVLLDSLELKGGMVDEQLKGQQALTLAGLSVKHDKLNRLLGKELLASDLALGLKLAGPPEALGMALKLDTRGGSVRLDGTLDASRFDNPGYDVKLTARGLKSARLLDTALSSKLLPIELEKLTLDVDGRGAKLYEIKADIALELEQLQIGKVLVSGASLRGRLENGTLRVESLTIRGLGQTLNASGSYRLSDKRLHLELAVNGDVGQALAELKAAGLPIQSKLPPGVVTAKDGKFSIRIDGKLDESLNISLPKSELLVAGGKVSIDASTDLIKNSDPNAEKRFNLGELDARVKLSGVSVSRLGKALNRPLTGMDGRIDGEFRLSGSSKRPKARLALELDLKSDRRGRERPHLHAKINGSASPAGAELSLVVDRRGGAASERVLTLEARLPVDAASKKLAPRRAMSVKLDLPERKLSELYDVLPDRVALALMRVPDAKVSAHADIGGTPAAPQGTFDVSVKADAIPGTDGQQRLNLNGTLTQSGGRTRLAAKASGFLDDQQPQTVALALESEFSCSPLLGPGAEVDWRLDLGVGPIQLEELPFLLRRPGLAGKLEARAALHGNNRDVQGKLDVALNDLHKDELGPIDAALHADLEPAGTQLDLTLDAAGLRALRADGSVALAGDGLIPRARAKDLGDPAIALAIEVPRRKLAEFSKLRARLASAPGEVSGRFDVSGSVKDPRLNGGLTLDAFKTLDGSPGRARLGLSAGASDVRAEVDLGASAAQNPPVRLSAKAGRAELLGFLREKTGDASVEIALSARARAVPLQKLVPAPAASRELNATGQLDWNMDGRLLLSTHAGTRKLERGRIDGTLALSRGSLSLPGTKRRYHDVELKLSSSQRALVIERFLLHETDREKRDRRLELHGKLAWQNLRPQRANLELDAKHWLLFGSETLGKPDAPRAALSAKLSVASDLGGARRRVDVNVAALDLSMPERFNRAHWPEETHLGDVVYLDQPGARLGKLAVVKPEPPAEPAPRQVTSGPVTDIFVHIERPIHVQKPPFEMRAQGELAVRLKPGAPKPEVRGELRLVDGAMSLGGRAHRVDMSKRSRIIFDAQSPAGRVDFHLVYQPHQAALRDVSKASAGGDATYMHLEGPLSKPVATVSGVGNADLWDMLPVYNGGRVKHWSQPDMPASQTVQLPREYDVVLLSYMAVNLPHNLFLDRINAWADAYDERSSYGQIRHLEAERYSESGKLRVLTSGRPPAIGRSDAELELDYLFLNQPRTKAGVGVAAGNRLGGGPALFFEFSSDD